MKLKIETEHVRDDWIKCGFCEMSNFVTDESDAEKIFLGDGWTERNGKNCCPECSKN